MPTYKTTDYGLTFLPDGFLWEGVNASKLPMILDRDGTIFEPFLYYFGMSCHDKRRQKISSFKPEAYVLREWKAHLDTIGRPWDDVDDRALIDWREKLLSERKKKLELWEKAPQKHDHPESEDRIHLKLAIVFEFYLHAAEANFMNRTFVGPNGPITSVRPDQRRGPSKLLWKCAASTGRKMTKRPTPDDSAVHAILSHLRNTPTDVGVADRDWLIARTMAEAGLRAHEVAGLTVGMLEKALARENIRVPAPKSMSEARAAGWNPALHGLDSIAHWEPGRQAILEGLQRLIKNKRDHIYVYIVGKGGVLRDVPFPIEFFRDLIVIGIWEVRQAQLAAWKCSTLPPNLFLSEKTRDGLLAPTLEDLVKKAFSACGVEGSGHRLRAHFATKLAEKLWAKFFSDNLYRWDQTVQNNVLHKVSEALGHKSPTTTCQHYVELAQASYFKLGNKSHLQAMRTLINKVAENHRHLSEGFFEAVTKLIDVRAAAGSEGKGLDDILLEIAHIHAATVSPSEPVMEINPRAHRDGPSLRLVPKNDNP